MNTVYTVAFSGSKFLMVYNPKRGGWEMPGGRIGDNENITDAAVREYAEESGYSVEIVAVRETDECHVCAAVLGDKTGNGEFVSGLFESLPDELAFRRSEYRDIIEWAYSSVMSS